MNSKKAPVAVSKARRCAYLVIRRVFEQGAYADRAFRGGSTSLSTRDRQLAMRILYGAVQRKGTLDYLIEKFAERPVERLDEPVLAALRIGLYELLYMDGAPDRAVLADAVELAKRDGNPGYGLVNAILRRATREGQTQLQSLTEDSPEQAALFHSHPVWLSESWHHELGPEQARLLMAADNQPAEIALRVNTLKQDRQTLSAQLPVPSRPDSLLPEALLLEGPFDAYSSPQWRAGEFIAQSRAAMLVSRIVDPQPGERVLDLCAAPGGKSTHLAALMNSEGQIVAVEQNSKRAAELTQTAQRLGASNIVVQVADASTKRDDELFDRVLVDPPCSGLGTLQTNPDLRWRMNPAAVKELSDLQAKILSSAGASVCPGGVLVYSTCTISAIENEHQIEKFLDAHQDFHSEEPPGDLPNLKDLGCAGAPYVLTLPHRDHTTGFFIARLRRR